MTEEYEPPQAIHLNDSDRAYGQCGHGSTRDTGYRVSGFEGHCVTGKSAVEGCHAGISAGS